MLQIIDKIKIIVANVGEVLSRFLSNIVSRIKGWFNRYNVIREKQKQHGKYLKVVLDSTCKYNPAQVDVELGERLHRQIESLEDGKLIEKLKTMSVDERKIYFEHLLLPLVCNTMEVYPSFLGWFEDDTMAGVYVEKKKGIAMNSAFLSSDNELVLRIMVNTIIHECKHARQWDAVSGRDSHGYSNELIATWKENFYDYIQPEESDEGYYKQPVEWDARCFAEKVFSLDK